VARKRIEIQGQQSLFDLGELAEQETFSEQFEMSYPAEAVELERRMPPAERLRLGCSSWSFPGWAGNVYPANQRWSEQKLAKQGLALYAKHPLLRCVGLDRGYYAPIPPKDLEAYYQATPSTFQFLVKAPERVVSIQTGPRLAPESNPDFLSAERAMVDWIEPCRDNLKEKLGCLLLQFPPQKTGPVGGGRGFLTRLHQFLEQLPTEIPLAIELRNPELFGPLYTEILKRLEIQHCLSVHPQAPHLESQIEFVQHQPHCFVRWMLHPQLGRYETAVSMFEPFNRLVKPDDDTLELLARFCQQRCEDALSTNVIVNNKAEGCSPLTVQRLARRMIELG
jgi:uncharacterized protein YecE (DUF72 family)